MRLLIVEDEQGLCESIAKGLRLDGYEVDTCMDGNEAWEMILVENYDLVILDLNLPGMDGMEVLHRVREEDEETNILILSARGQVQDKIEGLDAGANDYMSKPFHFEELEARVRSLTRRKVVQSKIVLECGAIYMDTKTRSVWVKQKAQATSEGEPDMANEETIFARKELTLTRKELGVLEYLLLHQGRPVSQEELIQHVWDGSVDSFSNSIRVHMSALRKKLRVELGYDPIKNIVGQGYEIKSDI